MMKHQKQNAFGYAALALIVALILIGCTQTPARQNPQELKVTATATPYAASPTISAAPTSPALPMKKLDKNAIAQFMLEQTNHILPPYGTCDELKEFINGTLFCSAPSPIVDAMKIDTNGDGFFTYLEHCRPIKPNIIFDCRTYNTSKPSCGIGLSGCENGGYYAEFNVSSVRENTGFDIDPVIFINATVFSTHPYNAEQKSD